MTPRVVLIGATGMVGQGVLRACLNARDVTEIIVIGRRALPGYEDPRLRVFIVPDLDSFEAVDDTFADIDACFYCVGVSSFGVSEAAYRAVTYDLTLHVAQQLLARSPGMTMVYASGAGADSSEQGKTMLARIRGQTENALQRLPFQRVAIFRPSAIRPKDGIQSKDGCTYHNFCRATSRLTIPCRMLDAREDFRYSVDCFLAAP